MISKSHIIDDDQAHSKDIAARAHNATEPGMNAIKSNSQRAHAPQVWNIDFDRGKNQKQIMRLSSQVPESRYAESTSQFSTESPIEQNADDGRSPIVRTVISCMYRWYDRLVMYFAMKLYGHETSHIGVGGRTSQELAKSRLDRKVNGQTSVENGMHVWQPNTNFMFG